MIETIEELTKIGVHKIIVMLPYPEFKYHVLQCKNSQRCDQSRETFEKYREPILKIMAQIKSERVRLLDPAPQFCNEKVCPQIIAINGVSIPVVYDQDHPSVMAATMMGEHFKNEFKWALE
jgi:hypothetical protein